VSDWRAARTALRLLPRGRATIAVIVALGTASAIAEGVGITLFLPLLGPEVGDAGTGPIASLLSSIFGGLEGDARMAVVAAAILAAVVLRSALAYGRDALVARLYGRVTHGLRKAVHDRLLAAEFGWLQRTDQGRLVNGLANETWSASDAIVTLLQLFTNAATVVVYGALLLLLSWQLSIGVGLALLVMTLIVRVLTRTVGRLSAEMTTANARLATRMMETCGGGRVIRTFAGERAVQGRFDATSTEVASLSQRMEMRKALVGPVYEVLAAAVIVGMLLFSLRGEGGDLASALVFLALLYRLQPRVKEIDALRVQLLRLVGGIEDVTSLIEETPIYVDGGDDATPLAPRFTFEHVDFTYEGGSSALRDVSVEIPAGATVALVGPSGAGKSTFVDLLLGLHRPPAGRVLMDGRSYTTLDLTTVRAKTALVGQDTFLFNTTVRENVAFARPDATDAEIEEAAQVAHADGFIRSLPQGWDTVVGDGGLRLSGGQRQRIALARAVLRQPEVLVLDEATSALDSLTERIVQDALEVLTEGRTVLIVAHRLATIARADWVIVLDEGGVVQQGAPAELMADPNGLFARMVRMQAPIHEVGA
jgi:subfamily B ATP-binding cassette protein MsbA